MSEKPIPGTSSCPLPIMIYESIKRTANAKHFLGGSGCCLLVMSSVSEWMVEDVPEVAVS